ncbi:MAG: LytTR family transcriptional regulator [Lactococcus plantarum]|nr:LytTR family transcriptional regulator [Lactococcus plantarum]MDN6083864.1 LytTR family transcriptional regulator [Lactococcus plantarum]
MANKNLKIIMNQLKDITAQESVIFNLFRTNSTINKVIDMLRQSSSTILATELQTAVQYKVKFADILYLDYVDRNVCLYTKDASYWVKISFIKILTQLPSHFVQISKNNAVNIYEVQSVETNIGGNLIIKLSTDEKLVVSRRYIKNFKLCLIEQT